MRLINLILLTGVLALPYEAESGNTDVSEPTYTSPVSTQNADTGSDEFIEDGENEVEATNDNEYQKEEEPAAGMGEVSENSTEGYDFESKEISPTPAESEDLNKGSAEQGQSENTNSTIHSEVVSTPATEDVVAPASSEQASESSEVLIPNGEQSNEEPDFEQSSVKQPS
ncbi:hypothetical protein L0F63_000726, partial [Massospora cicadina]